MVVLNLRAHLHRAVMAAMVNGIGHQIREQLRQAVSVATDPLQITDIRTNLALRVHALHFRYHMLQRRL